MKALDGRERHLAAVRHYEYDAMVTELSYLEKLAAPSGADESERLRSLENRPFAARLLETRAADLVLGWVQWAGERITGRAERRVASAGSDTLPGRSELMVANRVPLDEVSHDPSILQRRPRILLDLTAASRGPARAPANRAARAMAEAAVRTGTALPVLIAQGRLYPYYRHLKLDEPINPGDGDMLAIAGTFWCCAREYPDALRAAATAGASSALLLHDVFPLRFPAMYPTEVVDAVETGILTLLPLMSVCVVAAGSTGDDLRSYLNSVGQPARVLRFEKVEPGLAPPPSPASVRASVISAFDGNATYVSVGALEPRNGHAITLDACDLAWADGKDFSYAIVGPYRWRTQSVRRRILDHPEFNRRLFWISDPTTAEIAYAYEHCRATIVASVAEADDLPILAAARYGAPVIASDLPVLRGTGYADAQLFPVGVAPSLAKLIGSTRRSARDAPMINARTWDDCIRQLVECLTA